MSTFSAQPTCSITSNVDVIDLSDLQTVTLTSSGSSYTTDTITLNSGGGGGGSFYTAGGYGGGAGGSYTITSGAGISSMNIGPITVADIKIQFPEEWKDCFPDWDRMQKMCNEYPGLKIAFEKFKNTYNLVKDDYDAPPNKKIRP